MNKPKNAILGFSDVCLTHSDSSLGLIYITAYYPTRGQPIVFMFERVIYDEAIDDNRELETYTLDAKDFSTWLEQKRVQGWTFDTQGQ